MELPLHVGHSKDIAAPSCGTPVVFAVEPPIGDEAIWPNLKAVKNAGGVFNNPGEDGMARGTVNLDPCLTDHQKCSSRIFHSLDGSLCKSA